MQAYAIGSQRVGFDAAIDLITLALAGNGTDKIARAPQRGARLQNVRGLCEIDTGSYVEVVFQRPPIIHHALQVCFGDGRTQRQILNFGARLIDASARVNVNVVDWPPIVNKSGVCRSKRNRVHPTRGGCVRIVRLNRRAQVPSLA